MKYTYGKEDLKEYLKNGYGDFLFKNADLLLNNCRFQALIVEVKAADDAGSMFVNEVGHDELSKDNLRIETKFTNYTMPTGEIRINSAGENKYGGFDVIRIIDGINKRIFEIPHDEYFNEATFYGNEFRWSSSYNSIDRKQMGNTQLLLKYETTNK
jgi:hypothetical protein